MTHVMNLFINSFPHTLAVREPAMDPSAVVPLIYVLTINMVKQFFSSQTGRQLIYFTVKHTTAYILKRAIWTPILNVIMEDVPDEYQWILEALYWFIVNQIIRHDANIIASVVVVIITL